MLLGPMHASLTRGGGRSVCVCVVEGVDGALRLLCRQRSIAPRCGKDNCPRASLNRRASMSGIANSRQPVAMTARGRDKGEAVWLYVQKCSTDKPLDPTPEARGWEKKKKKRRQKRETCMCATIGPGTFLHKSTYSDRLKVSFYVERRCFGALQPGCCRFCRF